MSILKAFNNHFLEFLEDVSLIFPNDSQLKSANLLVGQIVKTKPKMIVELWKVKINDKYKKEIEKGNYQFFINKDYSKNKNASPIKKIQQKIVEMSDENKNKSMKYVQNLSKLCNLYYINKD